MKIVPLGAEVPQSRAAWWKRPAGWTSGL